MRRGITLIIVAVLVLAAGLGALSISRNMRSTRKFVADGYILKPSTEEVITTEVDTQYYFAQGNTYKEKYGTKILFKDKDGTDVAIDSDQYLHYADGSLGSFTKGVLMNLSDIKEDQFGYYSLTKNTILVKNGMSYEMSSRGEAMELSEFIWKLSDTDYMIVSPEVTLHLSDSTEIVLPEYAQIKYVDSGIVRIVHQQGTYQTVSAETVLITKSGAELNLVGKSFYVNGEPVLSLDSMAIDDDSYIELDENNDSPELKIPTFNVINGKDGVSGTDGTSGETGTEGEDGEEGEEGSLGEDGTEGEEGVAGTEGSQGMEGIAGEDGVEGDTGIMGYDGAEGIAGRQALNADETSGIDPIDLLPRPTVSLNALDAAGSYDVTAGSANMRLSMDATESLEQGSTQVTVYDRATMQQVNTGEQQMAWGSALETGTLELALGGLAPDREYMVVVSGQYKVDQNSDAVEGTLFTKIFKTDSLGITIEKLEVTDHSVSVKTDKTAANVSRYDVQFFVVEEGIERQLALYNNLTGSEAELRIDKDTPNDSRRESSFTDMISNTMYYARIQNVYIGDSSIPLSNMNDTTVELKTLKKKPYKQGDETTSITAMQPTLTANAKTHSVVLSMDAVTDPDNGVAGYRYELYRKQDIDNAMNPDAEDNALAKVTPAFTKETDAPADQTFALPMSDSSNYVGRVVALFDDNEKRVEYSTLLSLPISLSEASASLVVEFDSVNKTAEEQGEPERLSGYIKVKDPTEVLLKYISNDNPMVLTISGEYEDVHTIKFTNSSIAVRDDEYYLFPFSKDGLRANSVYSLAVTGPCETDGVNALSEAEKATYLAGLRGITPGVQPLSLVSYDAERASAAFSRVINLTSPANAGGVGDDGSAVAPAAYFEYEAQILESLELELVHVDEDGGRETLGTTKLVDTQMGIDADGNALNHESDFYDAAWIDRSASITTAPNGGLVIERSEANTSAETAGFIVTPADFGKDNNDSIFFSGGYFEIRAKSGLDYTEKNVIPFAAGEDIITFNVERRHVQATNPNLQVSTELITNAGAMVEDSAVAQDTVVGLRFRADYPYSDVTRMKYYIYQLNDTDPATSLLDGEGNTPGQLFYEAGTTGVTGAVGVGDLVLVGERVGGASGGNTSTNVEVYFKDTTCTDNTITWYLADGISKVSDQTEKTILQRGGRYYIRYEVSADHTLIDCDHNGVNDTYPNCAYDSDVAVPYYRSRIIELDKQLPVVERYPWTSDSTGQTWMYRLIDPDKAIVQASDSAVFKLKQGSTAANAGTATGTDVVINELSTYTGNAFKAIRFNLTNNNRFYIIEIPYKRNSTAAENKIVSTPVLFTKPLTSAPNDIRCQGLMSDENTPVENIVNPGTDEHEKALINEGGYRYRLTLRGNDIANYAAVAVAISGIGNGGETYSVTFDPLYFDTVGTASDTVGGVAEMYAYVYLDSSPLKQLKDNGVTNASVEVIGYYSTKVSGVDGYISTRDNYDNKDLNSESVYALKTVDATGVGSYRKLSNGSWVSVTDGAMNGSLFIPGNSTGSGFSVQFTDGSSGGNLTQRYPTTPLSVSDTALGAQSRTTISLQFNENGMKDATSAEAAYYTVEKLARGSSISFRDDSHTISVDDIMPSVEKITITPGARSAYLQMKALGTGATDQSKIFAKLFSVPGSGVPQAMRIKQETIGEGADAVVYYVVDGEGDLPDDTAYENYKIPISTDANGNITAELRIRGLTKETKYQVVFFAYDSTGRVVDLYSLDGKRAGYPYTFNTLSETVIEVMDPTYVYTNYAEKSAKIGFAIPGDEGIGMTMHYELFEGETVAGTAVTSGTVAPLGISPNTYYAQDATKNHPIELTMNPSASTNLRLNTSYTVRVFAEDSVGDVVGEKTKTFTTPAGLKEPTFMVQASQSSTSTSATIRAMVSSTDLNRSMMNNQYTITCYPKNEEENTLRTDTVTRTGNTNTKVAEFSGELGQEYVIKITANIDTNNDGTRDKIIENEYGITATTSAAATIGASATSSELTLLFSNLQNFDDVEQIVVTAFNSDFIQIFSTTLEGPFISEGVTEFAKRMDWGTPTAMADGNYVIQVQYRSATGVNLGNDEINAIVSASNNRSLSGLSTLLNTRRAAPVPTASATQMAIQESTVAPTAKPTATSTTEPIADQTAVPTAQSKPESTTAPTSEPTAIPTTTPVVSSTTTPVSEGGQSGDSSVSNTESEE